MEERKKKLIEFLKIPTMSKKEHLVRDFIQKELDRLEIEYTTDSKGSVFLLRKNTPLLSAHMDAVSSKSDLALLQFIGEYDGEIKGMGNIGADDKVGCFIILELLRDENYRNKFSFVFSVEEEIGANGIIHFCNNYKKRIKKCKWFLVLDRKGYNDFISSENDYGIKEFEDEAIKLIGKYGYKATHGIFSDADTISDIISGANMSVGYYNAHSDDEKVIYNDVVRAIDVTKDLINNLNNKFIAPSKTRHDYNDDYNEYSEYEDYNDYIIRKKDESYNKEQGYSSKISILGEDIFKRKEKAKNEYYALLCDEDESYENNRIDRIKILIDEIERIEEILWINYETGTSEDEKAYNDFISKIESIKYDCYKLKDEYERLNSV
jgi:hypothetical protein